MPWGIAFLPDGSALDRRARRRRDPAPDSRRQGQPGRRDRRGRAHKRGRAARPRRLTVLRHRPDHLRLLHDRGGQPRRLDDLRRRRARQVEADHRPASPAARSMTAAGSRSARTASSTSPPARPAPASSPRTRTPSAARSCDSSPTGRSRRTTRTRSRPSGRSDTATSRASPGTTTAGCGPASSATSTWDELNLIEKGNNYGWPAVEGKGDLKQFTNPVRQWSTDDLSPSGIAYLDGSLYIAGLKRRAPVPDPGPGRRRHRQAGSALTRASTAGCVPSSRRQTGQLWFTTSNRDGRSVDPADADDRIFEIRPQTAE